MSDVIQGQAPAPEVIATPETDAALQTQQAVAGQSPESEAQGGDSQAEIKAEGESVKKRIDTLTWRAREAERIAADAQARAEAADKAALALYQRHRDYERPATAPTLAQYNYDAAQFEAAVRAHNEKYISEQRQLLQDQAAAAEQQRAVQQHARTLTAKMAEGSVKYADYTEVLNNPQLPKLATQNPLLLQAMIEHENMVDITYYLAKNVAEAHRIAALPPARAIMEVGRIAAQLPANMPRRTSNAPPPPGTVGGRGTTNAAPADNDPVDVWLAKREAQLAKQRGDRGRHR